MKTMSIENPERRRSRGAAVPSPQPGWSAFDPVNDDTDIFLANPQIRPARPNVLIFVDKHRQLGPEAGHRHENTRA
jgi:hypothetical protein